MERWLGRYQNYAYALLRLVAGGLFTCHGAQKLFGLFGAQAAGHESAVMLVAGIVEFFGGLAVAVGWRASIAAFLASGQMAVAYFWFHAPGGFWPIVNNGELAVLYSFLFLYFAAHGSGVLSLDTLLEKRFKKKNPTVPV